MKHWTKSQLFFVYDSEYCVREEDDPRDAIIYFHPNEMPDSIRCGLCCQLMGIVQFSSTCFSAPTLIRLQRSKFAIKKVGRFTLALSGMLGMPDPVLQRQLKALHDIFIFYHKSINDVHQKCGKLNDVFVECMYEIWDHYLPISQYFGNSHSLTFCVVPVLDLPKSAGSIYLQSSQILQSCQVKPGVIAGCIISRSQVLFSQLPPSIVKHLGYISVSEPQLPAVQVSLPFKLPEGVICIEVHLTADQVQDLKGINAVFEAPTLENLGERKPEGEAEVLPTPNAGSLPSSNNDETSADVGDKLETSSLRSFKETISDRRKSSVCELRNSENHHLKLTRASSLNKYGNEMKDHRRIYRTRSECVLNKEFNSLNSDSWVDLFKGWQANKMHNREPKADSVKYSEVSSDDIYSLNNGIESINKDAEDKDVLYRFILYIQGHSYTQLMLLLDENAINEPTVSYLGTIGLQSLVDLELEVDSCVERAPKKGSPPNYLYMQYDSMWSTFKGDLTTPIPTKASEQFFSRTTQLQHEAFVEDPSIQELILRFGPTVVYSHYLGSLETHFQQFFESSPDQNPPLLWDLVSKIGDNAKKCLEDDHGIVLL